MALGFYFDQTRCAGCRVCQIACKDRMDLQNAGPIPRRVASYEVGTYPEVSLHHTSVGCNHCDNPSCVRGCPTGAMYKDEATGIVLHDDSLCIGCRSCMMACPYGAPQFDDETAQIVKCDSCKALREAGMNPVCVDACMMRALDFGEIDELRSKYGSDLVSEIPAVGDASITSPNLLIKASRAASSDAFVEIVL
ncbi:MAG: 4Fe-4S dicluster domain-containing protein [Eggerthellaceae bacterium]|nr:4Fe-4S dicluster domain-containing protein [Eggerthellaceae bacterium]